MGEMGRWDGDLREYDGALIACRPLDLEKAAARLGVPVSVLEGIEATGPLDHGWSTAICEGCSEGVRVGVRQQEMTEKIEREHPHMPINYVCMMCAVAIQQAREALGTGQAPTFHLGGR